MGVFCLLGNVGRKIMLEKQEPLEPNYVIYLLINDAAISKNEKQANEPQNDNARKTRASPHHRLLEK
jgi:hypothetical protein